MLRALTNGCRVGVYNGVINFAMSWRAHASFYIWNNDRFFFGGSRRLFIEKRYNWFLTFSEMIPPVYTLAERTPPEYLPRDTLIAQDSFSIFFFKFILWWGSLRALLSLTCVRQATLVCTSSLVNNLWKRDNIREKRRLEIYERNNFSDCYIFQLGHVQQLTFFFGIAAPFSSFVGFFFCVRLCKWAWFRRVSIPSPYFSLLKRYSRLRWKYWSVLEPVSISHLSGTVLMNNLNISISFC